MRKFYRKAVWITIIFIIISYTQISASVFVYNPLSTDLNPTKPSIYFIDPQNPKTSIVLGDAHTSANITIAKNLALNVYDQDQNGYIYLRGPSPNTNLASGKYYEVGWKIHIPYFNDPTNNGMLIIDVHFYNGFDDEEYLVSIIYYGSYVKAALGLLILEPTSEAQSTPYTIDPNKEHYFKIRIERSIDGETLIAKWIVDGNEIFNHQWTGSAANIIIIYESYFGWLNQDKTMLTFNAYIDEAYATIPETYNVSEDFEDETDNIFIEERSGNCGKEIVYYTYPQNSLKIYDDFGRYNISLEAYIIEGVIPDKFNASLWLNTSQSIKIVNGEIIVSKTSEITMETGGYVSLYVNATIPYPSTWNLIIKLYLKYRINEAVTVSYPITVKSP